MEEVKEIRSVDDQIEAVKEGSFTNTSVFALSRVELISRDGDDTTLGVHDKRYGSNATLLEPSAGFTMPPVSILASKEEINANI